MERMSGTFCSAHCFFIFFNVEFMLFMTYLCHRKQGEKIDCYIPYCTSNFGVQGGRDATLFFFYAK